MKEKMNFTQRGSDHLNEFENLDTAQDSSVENTVGLQKHKHFFDELKKRVEKLVSAHGGTSYYFGVLAGIASTLVADYLSSEGLDTHNDVVKIKVAVAGLTALLGVLNSYRAEKAEKKVKELIDTSKK